MVFGWEKSGYPVFLLLHTQLSSLRSSTGTVCPAFVLMRAPLWIRRAARMPPHHTILRKFAYYLPSDARRAGSAPNASVPGSA